MTQKFGQMDDFADTQLRIEALRLAKDNARGYMTADLVVADAKEFYQFLKVDVESTRKNGVQPRRRRREWLT